MSSMKQFAAQVLRDDEVIRFHALTSASFRDSCYSSSEAWKEQACNPSTRSSGSGGRQALQASGKPGASLRDRWPDFSIHRDFGFGTVRAVLRRRLAPQCRVLLCLDKMLLNVRTVHRVVLAGVDAVLVRSDALARAVHGFGVPASRIVLSSGCNDLALFDSPARPRMSDGICRVVHVGDLEPEAGVADFLLCVAAWAERNPQRQVVIRWYGEGCLRGVLEAQPLPPNLQHSFSGRITRKDLATAFPDHDMLALPALVDPWDDVVPEALAARLPVLGSTRSRAVADLVVHGTTGWVFNPFESGSMARAVETALSTLPGELDRMRVCAVERPKPSLPSLNERIWRAMRLEGKGPDFDPASLGLAL